MKKTAEAGTDTNEKPDAASGDRGKTDGHRDILRFKDNQLFEVEQFKVLRTKVLFPSTGKSPRSIAVTGVDVGEGKSFVAANLAVNIAQNVDDRKTLLIDCDMRRPMIHRLFGFDRNVPGLSEYLSGEKAMSEVLLKTWVDKLQLLPGGKPPHNPSELLTSVKMSALLQEVQQRYDDRYIVIELPSPRLAAEAEIVARHMDGVIIVVRYGQTSKTHAAKIVELLGKENILGVVFNRFDTSMHSSVYRMYRKYIRR